MKVNEGEVPQYYAEDSHPVIVSREVHDLVQHELRRRKGSKMRKTGWNKNGRPCFASRIVCADCGSFYGSKIWHSTDKYKRVIWQCNHKFKGEQKCQTPHLTEPQIEQAFINMVNGMIENKDEVLAAYDEILVSIDTTDALERQRQRAKDEAAAHWARMRKFVDQNAHIAQNQDEYNRKYNEMDDQYNLMTRKINVLSVKLVEQRARIATLKKCMETLRGMDGLVVGFDEKQFVALVEKVVVGRDGTLRFVFNDESER